MALRVLICASEVVPFAKTGGLADVAGALPKALAALGHDTRVALPKYSTVDLGQEKPRKVGSVTVPLGGEVCEIGIEISQKAPGVTAYLVDSPQHFARKPLYGEPDDGHRFAVYCRAVLEFLRKSDWRPQVIHANDWQTGLIPVYLKRTYAGDQALGPIATLYTVHNLAYQGLFPLQVLDDIGLDASLFRPEAMEFYGQVNFLKGGLVFADLLSTVSPSYAKEILTEEYGEGLEGVLQKRSADLYGVLNGLDVDEWNPATDEFIAARYDATDPAPKAADKQALQQRLALPQRAEVPVLGIVSRLAGQKGFDLLAEVLPDLLQLDLQFVILGTGEAHYHELLSDFAKRYPQKLGLKLGFDNPLAHLIYAGSDLFLMPSQYEPCGLGQMISLRYGTIPVVRHVGGLADTVVDLNADPERGNGFSFAGKSGAGLMGAVVRALMTMQDHATWDRLVRKAMACDFSWARSAEAYVGLYQRAIARHGS
jgi:starch synthase